MREMLVAGGFPEARRRSPDRRVPFFDSYLDTVLDRDLGSIARVHDRANVRRLLNAVAATTGSALNLNDFSRDLGIAANTVRAYVDLLETLFLVYRLPAWHSNLLSRLVQGAEAAHRRQRPAGVPAQRERRACLERPSDRRALIETFVVMELVRLVERRPRSSARLSLSRPAGHEVDMVLERRDGTSSESRRRPPRPPDERTSTACG